MLATATTNETRSQEFQVLKGRIHQDLLNRLNLDRLTKMSRAEAEPEIRSVIQNLLDRENQRVPLSLADRDQVIADVLNELFGLGPLEVLLSDPNVSDILVNSAKLVFIEREGKLEETERRVPRRQAPDADHRAHRECGRPAH
jgi:pilus assembly protein CpaF